MKQQRQPWERLEGESTPAFQAFACYRDLNAERSLSVVAQTLAKSKQLLQRWSSRHQWVERCRAFDLWEDDRLREENLRQRRQMMARISTQALMMQRIAVNSFKRLGDGANLSPDEAARYCEIGSRLEMRARGEPEEGQCASVHIHVGKREPEPHVEGLCAPRKSGESKGEKA